jgi:hypothetical protein
MRRRPWYVHFDMRVPPNFSRNTLPDTYVELHRVADPVL